MVKKEKDVLRIEDFLTESKFAKKHGLTTKKEREFVSSAFNVLYKIGLYAKNPAGNMVQVVRLNKKSHSPNSRLKVPVYFENRVLQEVKNQEKIAAAKVKVVEK